MRIAAIALLLLASSLSFAQATFGLRGGFGQSGVRSGAAFDLVTDQLENTSVTSFGVFAEVPISPIFSFRPGLEYTQRGTEVGLTEDLSLLGVALPLGAQAETRFNYLDAPLLLQVNLPTESSLQPYAFAGPSLGYAIGGKLRTTARALIEFQLSETDIDLESINYERFHVAAMGGVGAKATFGNGMSGFVEARYEYGLSQPYDVPLATDKVGFRGWNLGAGLAFAL